MAEGMTIGRSADRKEGGKKDSTALELLAHYGPVEVTRYRIATRKHFYLDAQDEWTGFEFIYVLEGKLAFEDDGKRIEFHSGDCFHHRGLPKRAYFRVEEDAILLMVSSPPSYRLVREEIQSLMALARSVEERDAAYLHDVGKVKVPDEILNKAEPLTEEEWEEMHRHPEYGAEMLNEKEFLRAAARIVRAHHERYDGRGYPDGLEGEEIPIEARIIAVVDTYDAITSERPYQPALGKKKALEELRNGAGSQFDARVAEAFIAMVGGDD